LIADVPEALGQEREISTASPESHAANYFEQLKQVLGVDTKADLHPLAEAFRDGKLRIPQWEFNSPNPLGLMGLEKIATRP
jgi:hypothetical protein